MELPRAFVGFVLLPIVGNAAEHATAIGMAYREKLDLAIAVALGSSTQIALFVIPLMVVVGWLLPGLDNDMTLDFPPFETTVTMLSVIIVAFQVQVGEVTYLSGFVLVVAYVIIALSFVYLHRKVEMIPVPGDPRAARPPRLCLLSRGPGANYNVEPTRLCGVCFLRRRVIHSATALRLRNRFLRTSDPACSGSEASGDGGSCSGAPDTSQAERAGAEPCHSQLT